MKSVCYESSHLLQARVQARRAAALRHRLEHVPAHGARDGARQRRASFLASLDAWAWNVVKSPAAARDAAAVHAGDRRVGDGHHHLVAVPQRRAALRQHGCVKALLHLSPQISTSCRRAAGARAPAHGAAPARLHAHRAHSRLFAPCLTPPYNDLSILFWLLSRKAV